MKRIYTSAILTTFFALTVMILSVSSAQAQHDYRLEKQIRFAPDKSSAIVKGRISGERETHEYKFKARAGQTLSVKIAARNTDIRFMILDADGAPVGSSALKTFDWTGELPTTGEYQILVYPLSEKGAYSLSVEIK